MVGIAVERMVRSKATRNMARKLATNVSQNLALFGWYKLGPGGPPGPVGPGGPEGVVGTCFGASESEDISPTVGRGDAWPSFAVSVDERHSLAASLAGSFSASLMSRSMCPLFLRDLSYRSTLVRLLASDVVDRDILVGDRRSLVGQEEQLLQLQQQAGGAMPLGEQTRQE